MLLNNDPPATSQNANALAVLRVEIALPVRALDLVHLAAAFGLEPGAMRILIVEDDHRERVLEFELRDVNGLVFQATPRTSMR